MRISVVALALILSGCGGTAAPTSGATPVATPSLTQIGTLTLSASDCTLNDADGPIRAGRIGFTALNETDAEAWFDMGRISEGHSYEELTEDIGEARQSAEVGGPEIHRPSYLTSGALKVLDAGESSTMFATVQSGTYAIVCLRMFETVAGVRPFAVIGPLEVEE